MSHSSSKPSISKENIFSDIRSLIRYWQTIFSERDVDSYCYVSKDRYDRIKEITFRISDDAQKLNIDNESNNSDWGKIVALINQINSLFVQRSNYLFSDLRIHAQTLYHRINDVEIVLYRLEHSSKKRRREDQPLLQIVESDLEKNNIFFEGNESSVNEPGIQDFILLTFYSEKDEIEFTPVNEPAGKYILSQGKAFEETLDRFTFDSLILEHQAEGFEGSYMETGVIINEVDDETIYTKTMDGFGFNCDKLSQINIPSTIGEYFLEQIDAPKHPYYIIFPTVADSDMSILFAVKEVVTLDDIYQKLKKIMVDGYWVGMAYEDDYQYFTLGYVHAMGHGTPFMVTIEEFRKLRMVHNDPFESW